MVLPTFHANLASTVYLLDALSEQGCKRIVQAGSLEEPEPGDPVSTPTSPYAAAKWSAGAYARMFHQLWSTPVVLARLFMVYGPEQRDLSKLVPHVVTSLLLGGEPQLGSGKRPVDWVYVDDVVEGLLRLGLAEGVEGLQVDLSSGKLVPVRAVVEQIYALLAPGKQPPFGSIPDRQWSRCWGARRRYGRSWVDARWRAKTGSRAPPTGTATSRGWRRRSAQRLARADARGSRGAPRWILRRSTHGDS